MYLFAIEPPEDVTVSDELSQTLAVMSKSKKELKVVRKEQNQKQ